MEIKYSKFEINMWDIFFLVIYLILNPVKLTEYNVV